MITIFILSKEKHHLKNVENTNYKKWTGLQFSIKLILLHTHMKKICYVGDFSLYIKNIMTADRARPNTARINGIRTPIPASRATNTLFIPNANAIIAPVIPITHPCESASTWFEKIVKITA